MCRRRSCSRENRALFSPAIDFSSVGHGEGWKERDMRGRDARDAGVFCMAKQIQSGCALARERAGEVREAGIIGFTCRESPAIVKRAAFKGGRLRADDLEVDLMGL